MELFSLVVINLLFCGVIYVLISAKVQRSVEDYNNVRLQRAIEAVSAETMRELDATITLVESKMVAFRTLVDKAEGLVKELRHYETKQPLSMESEILSDKNVIPKRSIPYPEESQNLDSNEVRIEQRSAVAKVYQSNQIPISKLEISTTENAVNQAFGKLGKAMKGVFGMETMDRPSNESIDSLSVPTMSPKMNFMVGGDPFSEEPNSLVIRNDLKNDGKRREFLNQVSKANDPSYAAYANKDLDKVTISFEAVLEELPSSATKIDKVVHLLKKGYKKEEISDFMNIGIHEIHLIETIRLDRSRRI